MTEFQYLDEGNSEAQDRLATSFLLAQVSTGKAATGVLAGLLVAQTGTASVSVLIDAGAGASQDTVGNGVAIMVNDTQKTLDVLTANPMGGTPRNDMVVFDAATKSVRAIIGTPNAVPTDPTVPTTAIPLARLRHAASATTIPTAKIDDIRVFTSLFGGPFVKASTANAGKRIHGATYAIGATGGASVTVTHGAGFTPTWVVPACNVPGVEIAADTFTSTTFTIRARIGSTGANYGSAFTLYASLGE